MRMLMQLASNPVVGAAVMFLIGFIGMLVWLIASQKKGR